MIEVSAQYGDPKAADKVWPMHRQANELLERYAGGTYFRTVEKWTVVLRVSGRVRDFGGEGLERLRHLPKDNEMTVDLVIPERRWRGSSDHDFRLYFAKGIHSALLSLLDLAREKHEVLDADILMFDLGKVVSGLQEA